MISMMGKMLKKLTLADRGCSPFWNACGSTLKNGHWVEMIAFALFFKGENYVWKRDVLKAIEQSQCFPSNCTNQVWILLLSFRDSTYSFLTGPNPASSFVYFRSFKTQILEKKLFLHRDSNSDCRCRRHRDIFSTDIFLTEVFSTTKWSGHIFD